MASPIKSENAAPPPHVALFPVAGMGHLMPFLRLAAMLHSRGCAVTIITVNPIVSAAESDHLSAFFAANPRINRLEFQLLPYKSSGFTNEDPFFIQMERVGNSVHLLHPLLSSVSPPLSSIFVDFPVLSQLVSHIHIPIYTLIITSARFLSLMAYLPHMLVKDNINVKQGNHFEIPALGRIPTSSIPPPMLDPNHFFAENVASNAMSLQKLNGVLINTFVGFESEAIESLKRNGVEKIFPVGPLESYDPGLQAHNLPWLDGQAPGSVLYVSFGSRTALSKEQLRELGAALEKSRCPFLWVLKGNKVDKEDNEEMEEILGASFLERTKKQGIVVKGWVNQEQVLADPAIGGFVSHCGWNSVIEAARLGVPVLAWPLHGDQRVNAEVVEKAGFGIWAREWGWGGERLVERDEIVDMVMELMEEKKDKLRAAAKEVRERARQERESGGNSERLLRGLIESMKSDGK